MSNVDHISRKADEANDDKHFSDNTYQSSRVPEVETITLTSAAYRVICVILLLLSYFLSQYDK